jgi:hypothetical protein
MMKIDCDITELIRSDFNSLWRCTKHGETLEISVPYLRPDSKLFSVYITKREDRYIVCDGGDVWDLLSGFCNIPLDERKDHLAMLAERFNLKEGSSHGAPLFFNECNDPGLISSRVFDLANFATMAASSLVSFDVFESQDESRDRFARKANDFIEKIIPADFTIKRKCEISQVQGFKFSAVIATSSKIWLVSYVNGSDQASFRKNINDVAKSFKRAWSSSLSTQIQKTIPLINNEARGYNPDKLGWVLDDLRADSKGTLVEWTQKESISQLLTQ